MQGSARLRYILLTILFFIAAVNFTKTTSDILNSSKRLDDLKAEVDLLEDEKESLSADLEYKKTDDYIEENARNDLNLVKPGEQVFVVVGDMLNNKTNSVDSNSDTAGVLSVSSDRNAGNSPKSKDNNLYLWYRLFF